MKLALVCSLLALASATAFAQDTAARYAGTEKLTVSSCGTFDGVSTGPWSLAIEPKDGKAVEVKGSAAGGGDFSGKGELDGATLSAKVFGINRNGSAWNGTIEATLDGDRLVGKTSGAVRGMSCRFVSEFDTKKLP